MMKRSTILALSSAATLGLVLAASGLMAKPTSYNLPAETATLKPGPNLDVVRNNCTGCHSAEYIATQPKGAKFKEDFWKSEVNKMINVYGAPINQPDVGKIVEYLSKTYAE